MEELMAQSNHVTSSMRVELTALVLYNDYNTM